MAISLTAGMRSNLFGLQQTAKLMDQTAIRLNTGKKVNSALDDPISYFAAKGHMSRVSSLGALKNGMSEGIQTITAANNGIEAIISLLSAAKAKAESAQSAEAGSANVTGTVTLTGIVALDTITVGDAVYTGGAAGTTAKYVFDASGTDAMDAANLAALINSNNEGTTGGDAASVNVKADGVTGSTIQLSVTGLDMTSGTVESSVSGVDESLVAASDELSQLQAQYNVLLTQMDDLQDDADYKGINLLKLGEDLSVDFEGTNTMTVSGFDADHDNLTVTDATWSSGGSITNDIGFIENAIATLESKASSLASSLSIITVRQDFTENMINTLTTGADNLTLADMNEEGANMLMLQTQQALGTNSLSLAAQTAQGVLRLF